jgi:hypothetical protein
MTRTEEMIEHLKAINDAINILDSVSYNWRGQLYIKKNIHYKQLDLEHFLEEQIKLWNSDLEEDEAFIFTCKEVNRDCEIFTINDAKVCNNCARDRDSSRGIALSQESIPSEVKPYLN